MEKREKFSSSMGFILSCVGAAIGLGNIWMFPYRMGKNGGAVFLIPYLFFVIVLGTVGLVSEISFGRLYQSGSLESTIKAFKEKNIRFGKLVGFIPVIVLFGTFMFYNVVVGWIIKYLSIGVTDKIKEIEFVSYFNNFTGSPQTIFWNALAIIITLIIVYTGVVKGIEKINTIIMPVMFVILCLLIIRSLTLPGAIEGVKFLLVPDCSYLFKVNTWINALGQAFFSVSITGCCIVAYGSYTKKDVNIPKVAICTVCFDTVAALLSAFVIMPAVFACGLDPLAGPPLLFITIPSIFSTIPGSQILSILFFFSVLLAAISSAIAMLEGPTEALMSQTKISRKKAAILLGIIGFLLSIPLNLNMSTFDNFTNLITIVLSPLSALITMIVFYYVVSKKKVLEEVNQGATIKFGDKFYNFAKYVFIPIIAIIIMLGIALGGIG